MLDDDGRLRLRRTFTEDAALYDRARPGYPAGFFEEFTPRRTTSTC
ncbi:hypothetical protein ABH927_000635 [Planotetraspora sp. GP83]